MKRNAFITAVLLVLAAACAAGTAETPAATATAIIPSETRITTVTPEITKIITPVATPAAEPQVKLDKNYINISKGEKVIIKYIVEREGETIIRVFNLNGEVVRDFYRLRLGAGEHSAYWDGTNDTGNRVGKGMYFVVVRQPAGQTTKKLVVIK
jgi:hypothetical protein